MCGKEIKYCDSWHNIYSTARRFCEPAGAVVWFPARAHMPRVAAEPSCVRP